MGRRTSVVVVQREQQPTPDPCDGRTLRGRPTAATRCIRCHRAVAGEILHTTFIDCPSSMLMRWSASLLLPILGDRTGSPRPGTEGIDRTSLVGKGQATPENGCEPPSGSQRALDRGDPNLAIPAQPTP